MRSSEQVVITSEVMALVTNLGHSGLTSTRESLMRLAALIVILVAFTAWSLVIVAPDGLPGLFALLRERPWGQQVFVDLCIALTVSWIWLVPEARARGIPAWPYLVATPFVGSIAVLAFLIHRELVSRTVKGSATPSIAAR